MTPMFSVQNRIPVWVLETGLDVPLHDVRKDVYTEIFPLPDGIVMSLMAYIYIDPEQPKIFHQILDLSDHENRYFFNYCCDGELRIVYLADGAGNGEISHTLTPADQCQRFAATTATYFDAQRDQAPGAGEAQYRAIAAQEIANEEFAKIWDLVEAHCLVIDRASAQPAPRERQAQTPKAVQQRSSGTGYAIAMTLLTVLAPVAGGAGLATIFFGQLMAYNGHSPLLFYWMVGLSGLLAFGLALLWLRSFKYVSATIRDIRSVPADIMRAYNKPETVRSNAKHRLYVTLAGVCGGFSLWYLLIYLSLAANRVFGPHFGWDDVHLMSVVGGFLFIMIALYGGVGGILYTLMLSDDEEN